MYEILYKICGIKQIIFKKYENEYIPRKPDNLRFAPVIFF